MTPVDVTALRELLAKATPGEWRQGVHKYDRHYVIRADDGSAIAKTFASDSHGRDDQDAADARAIVALRNAALPLLDEVEALRAEVGRLREWNQHLLERAHKAEGALLRRAEDADYAGLP